MRSLLLMGLALVAGCTNDPDPVCFGCHSPSQPGQNLPEGGELRHEHVTVMGQPAQTQLLAYQYTAPATVTAPFPAPEPVHPVFGDCVDERVANTWPFAPFIDATFVALPLASLSGPGIAGTYTLPQIAPPTLDEVPRHYDIAYGGTALPVAMSQLDGEYTIDIGIGDAMTYVMPAAYTPPLGIGGSATIAIPRGHDLNFTWTDPPNDFGADGMTHTKHTHFNYTLFLDPNNPSNPPQFICFPSAFGDATIPQSVIDALPASGLIVNASFTHYQEAREVMGAMRRFDLVAEDVHLSAYALQ